MIKWVEIARSPSPARYEILQDFLRQKGIENQFEALAVETQDFPRTLEEVFKTHDSILLGSPYKVEILPQLKSISAKMQIIRSVDCMFREGDTWWPRSVLNFAMEDILTTYGAHVDLDASALIVGAGGAARLVCAALIKMGLKKINITNKDNNQGLALIEDFKRYYFDVEFEFIPQNRLVLLPGTNCVLINTTPLSPQNELLYELYYFNFLQASGLVIDLTIIPYDTPLILEAKAIDLKVVHGYELAVRADVQWVEWMTGQKLNRDEYLKYFYDKVVAIPFDPTPYRNQD